MPQRCRIALLPILLGGLIYLIFRQDIIALSLIPADWLHIIKINLNDECAATYFFLYCLPDALWYSSLLLLQLPYTQSIQGKGLFGLSVFLPFIMEFCQKFGIISGTFDWWDIVAYLIVLTLILLIWNQKKVFKYLLCR